MKKVFLVLFAGILVCFANISSAGTCDKALYMVNPYQGKVARVTGVVQEKVTQHVTRYHFRFRKGDGPTQTLWTEFDTRIVPQAVQIGDLFFFVPLSKEIAQDYAKNGMTETRFSPMIMKVRRGCEVLKVDMSYPESEIPPF